ncbi:PREDICTED: wee1-like protein kinase [Nicotiana attenuata]|uniref:Wee1-like protein kinase n=1 Tax=Nicotiana attenuata TaxID=49451 RepID=A0A1J6ITA5_NICAT|nr:PREDICTED: wee1-like protein kinase [Nicotiana attenuata]OIT08078.1 wee1-like protein kinase [Nicotiana attenuata]
MKRKTLNRTSTPRRNNKSNTKRMNKGSLFTVGFSKVSLPPLPNQQLLQSSFSTLPLSNPSRFQELLDSEALPPAQSNFPSILPSNTDADAADGDNKDFILSQDFFCTPDYLTPDAPAICNGLSGNKDDCMPCPKSPEKLQTVARKRQRLAVKSVTSLSSDFPGQQQLADFPEDTFGTDATKSEKITESEKGHSYVSQSAIALRYRVMPPPCIRNPYLRDASEIDVDPFGNRRSKCAGFNPVIFGNDGLSRYRSDFHEVEQIGTGNFSRVFKVLKRIDGCMYAVKHSTKQLHQDTDRRKALMEVQALAALGPHENVVGYYSSWFENEHLYIQMELCDHSLSNKKDSKLFSEVEVLEAMYQVAKALQYIHQRGVAHLDVKPDNIYVKSGVYKLGDFGCATLLDKSQPIEEGDARYMPQEILNENYDHLDKVDVFSLGAAIYELIRGSPLPESGPHFLNLREGKLPLLPGHSLQFQNLLKVMMDPDPTRRPSAKDLVDNPIFERCQRNANK